MSYPGVEPCPAGSDISALHVVIARAAEGGDEVGCFVCLSFGGGGEGEEEAFQELQEEGEAEGQ